MGTDSGDDENLVDPVSTRLAHLFPDLAPELITEVVRDTHRYFADQPIRGFIPLLVENLSRTRLRLMRQRSQHPSSHTNTDAAGEVANAADPESDPPTTVETPAKAAPDTTAT